MPNYHNLLLEKIAKSRFIKRGTWSEPICMRISYKFLNRVFKKELFNRFKIGTNTK